MFLNTLTPYITSKHYCSLRQAGINGAGHEQDWTRGMVVYLPPSCAGVWTRGDVWPGSRGCLLGGVAEPGGPWSWRQSPWTPSEGCSLHEAVSRLGGGRTARSAQICASGFNGNTYSPPLPASALNQTPTDTRRTTKATPWINAACKCLNDACHTDRGQFNQDPRATMKSHLEPLHSLGL